MRERPILFSAPMVRALMRDENPKTQTRRPIAQKLLDQMDGRFVCGEEGAWCPYGQPGDRLWVREAWMENHSGEDINGHGQPLYRASWGNTPAGQRWKPSIHMPRWASRLTLEVTGVRVERLQDITEEDAKAEGATFTDFGKDRWGNQNPGWTMEPPALDSIHCLGSARYAFGNLINKINGPGTWDSNPWVWVVEFKRSEARSAPEPSSAKGSPSSRPEGLNIPSPSTPERDLTP